MQNEGEIILKKQGDIKGYTGISSHIVTHWSFCLSIISFFALLLGWLAYGVSPLYTIQEIGYQQQQESLKIDFVNFHNDLGKSFLYVEQFDAARNEFKQVLEVDPLNQKARIYLFECDVFSEASDQRYDPEVTQKKLEELEREDKNDPLVYLYLGDFAFRCNNREDAINYYQKTIQLDNSVANAYAGLGYIYDQQNKTDEALEMYNKALNLSRWNIRYRNNIAYIYYERNDYKNATDWYYNILLLDNRLLFPYYCYSNCCRQSGDLDSALVYQDTLIGLLDDENITNLKFNKDYSWFLYDKSREPIYLNDYPERKYYAYYSIALTYYLKGNENKTIEYVKRADGLHIDKNLESNMEKILDFDIDNLQKEQPNFRNRTIEFRNKFENL